MKNENYNRKAIAERIVELRDNQHMSFTTIATTLDAEGFKPRSANTFSQATVFHLYKTSKVKAVAATVAETAETAATSVETLTSAS